MHSFYASVRVFVVQGSAEEGKHDCILLLDL